MWENCNKAINICCNPLREQYLIDAEKEIKQETIQHQNVQEQVYDHSKHLYPKCNKNRTL